MNASPANLLLPLRIVRPSDLGPTVRARRREQSLRIDDAAALSGVSVDLLSRLENGKGSVRLDKLLTVLDGLGLALVVGPKDHPWMLSVAGLTTDAAERT
jgi:transcriptional regulator with XRE-family HTH domain